MPLAQIVSNNGSGATASITINNVQVGNKLVVYLWSHNFMNGLVSDTHNTYFRPIANVFTVHSNYNSISWADVVSGGNLTITAPLANTPRWIAIVAEVSDIASGAPDAFHSATSSSSNVPDSGATTASQPGDYVLSFASMDVDTTPFPAGTGFQRQIFQLDTGPGSIAEAEDQITSSTTIDGSWGTGAGGVWFAGVVAWRIDPLRNTASYSVLTGPGGRRPLRRTGFYFTPAEQTNTFLSNAGSFPCNMNAEVTINGNSSSRRGRERTNSFNSQSSSHTNSILQEQLAGVISHNHFTEVFYTYRERFKVYLDRLENFNVVMMPKPIMSALMNTVITRQPSPIVTPIPPGQIMSRKASATATPVPPGSQSNKIV